ncbi:hypothetical protein [Nocardioides lijunqiniae]|uniref:hypothetical protein n=1 Tax=Nocardioides lijunqiniae TaxID=2760832 RepID=UPI0018786E7C|nr:hypothetical protein [Nocardioides lijunqiniae]
MTRRLLATAYAARVRRTLEGMWFFILVALVVVGVVAYRMRVPLLARILGQSEGRVDRQLNRRKR